jgi:hypothetical protein
VFRTHPSRIPILKNKEGGLVVLESGKKEKKKSLHYQPYEMIKLLTFLTIHIE